MIKTLQIYIMSTFESSPNVFPIRPDLKEKAVTPPSAEEVARAEKFESPEATRVFKELQIVDTSLRELELSIEKSIDPRLNSLNPQSRADAKTLLEKALQNLRQIKETSDYEIYEYYGKPILEQAQKIFDYLNQESK